MAQKRSYCQFCGLARALDHVGERWTLLMIRELLLGPRRYKDFLRALPGLTSNLLAKRLKQLEADGIIERAPTGDARADAYVLTEHGAALEPVIIELGRWGARVMGAPTQDDRFDPAWALISMKRRYRGGEHMRAQFDVGDRSFVVELEPGAMQVRERQTDAADLRFTASFEALRKWWFLAEPLSSLRDDEQVQVDGAAKQQRRFCRAFEGLAY